MNLFKLVHVGCPSIYVARTYVGSWSSTENFLVYYYHPQMKFGQGSVFTSVCHSVHRRGCLPLGPGSSASGLGGCLRLSRRGCLSLGLGEHTLDTNTSGHTHGQSSFPPGHPFPCRDPLDTSLDTPTGRNGH